MALEGQISIHQTRDVLTMETNYMLEKEEAVTITLEVANNT